VSATAIRELIEVVQTELHHERNYVPLPDMNITQSSLTIVCKLGDIELNSEYCLISKHL